MQQRRSFFHAPLFNTRLFNTPLFNMPLFNRPLFNRLKPLESGIPRFDTFKRGVFAALVLAGAVIDAAPAFAQAPKPDSGASRIEEVLIFADAEAVRTLPGSAARIDQQQIAVEFANDINQLLKTVPGTYIREEDGYGLRPNIGIRGATSERSSKITLLEDGVMVAPAPYSNPAAYYFPTALRAHTVEVLKGAPLLRYGPQTTGGVVNIVSTPIPEELGGAVKLRVGEHGEGDLLAHVGARWGDFGYLLETAQRRSDGFKAIDRGAEAGYDIEDYLVKLSWETGRHSLHFKAQYSDELSNETYLGLSDVDFARDPNRRYGLSSLDEMDTWHRGLDLRYGFAFNDTLKIAVLAYHNRFRRDWFRLQNPLPIVNQANAGDGAARAALNGTADAFNLKFRSNRRRFDSRGVEANIDQQWGAHSLAYGLRLHRDDMDRFQPGAVYDQIDGQLVFFETLDATDRDNRREEAKALSAWWLQRWAVSDDLKLNLALRYEDVETGRREFARADRADAPARRGNRSRVWLPGASLTFDFSARWQALAGVHRGFSPLGGGARAFEEPETSINWEAGLRYRGSWFVEALAFYSDFDNKTENCSDANPCSNGQVAGSFTTGQAVIQGVEIQASRVWDFGALRLPFDFAYTYTDAALSKANPVDGFARGDRLAAVPENTLSLRIGLATALGWDHHAVLKYIDASCVRIGCNNDGEVFERTEDLLVVDLISRYAVNEALLLFLKMENLLDEQSIVSRQPAGARPNKPRTASIGLQYSF